MSDAISPVLYLVETVLRFLQTELERNQKVLEDVNKIKKHLRTMQAFLQDAEGYMSTCTGACMSRSEMIKTLVEQIRDVAYEMEDVLDDYMMHAPRSFSETHIIQNSYKFFHDLKHRKPVKELQSTIARIEATMSDIKKSPEYEKVLTYILQTQPAHRQEPAQVVEEDEIMGIDSHKAELIHLLLNESRGKRKTISVMGPCGAGKTVLVTSVYKSKSVIQHFDCHAWLSLSPTDNHEQRLQKLLSQFYMGLHSLAGEDSQDTANKLTNTLWEKRYIVVLDGARKEEEWASIKRMLPDCSNGSRIIITTQNGDVAERCAAPNNHILCINGLDGKEPWRLFCKKAYGNDIGECPPHLVDLSTMIVKKCERLPQPISAVGTLLSRKPRLQEEWSRVHDNLLVQMQTRGSNFLPSYYDLPSNQKSCLLYFSLFPEDSSVKRERLIRLWLSEGFADKSGTERLEKIAEDALEEMISRNLVEVCSRDFRGRVKSCRVQNLMREFLCQESKKKKFATVVTYSDIHRRDDDIKYRRLSIENASLASRESTAILHLDIVRSLFMFGLDKTSPFPVEETLQRIRLLKVLDLENAPLESFPECILDVALLLRYLSLRNTKVNMVPKNIKKLRYLEYLDLKRTQVKCLPEEIFSLHYLQHLLVYRFDPLDTFNNLQGVEIDGQMKELPFLQKLSILKVNRKKRFFEMLEKFTRLKKLGIVNLRENDKHSLSSCIQKMPHLSSLFLASSREEKLDLEDRNVQPRLLQHLYLKGRLTTLPTWIPSLSDLVRLLLRWSKLNASPIEKLQNLPNLMELEMIDAFTGEVLLFETGGFLKLRTLYIAQFDRLDTIVACEGGMPMLQKLTIGRCMHLTELPSGIEQLTGLEELVIFDMPRDFTLRLGKDSEDRRRIDHIPSIQIFKSVQTEH